MTDLVHHSVQGLESGSEIGESSDMVQVQESEVLKLRNQTPSQNQSQ